MLIIGFLLSLSAPSAVLSYLMVLASGMMAGRLMYWRKHNMHFAYYLIIVGFLIGYLLGAYYGNRNVIVILFILGAFFGYYLYEKKILRDTLF